VNSSKVAASEFGGETYVPSDTAREAGVVTIQPKSSNSYPLQIGASPASIYLFLCISEKIVCSTVSCVVRSMIDPS
jgi:hypothetical protein